MVRVIEERSLTFTWSTMRLIALTFGLNIALWNLRDLSGQKGEQYLMISIRNSGVQPLLANLTSYSHRSKEGYSKSLTPPLITESL